MRFSELIILALLLSPADGFTIPQSPSSAWVHRTRSSTSRKASPFLDIATTIADGASAATAAADAAGSASAFGATDAALLLTPVAALAFGLQAKKNREKIKLQVASQEKSLEEAKKALKESDTAIVVSVTLVDNAVLPLLLHIPDLFCAYFF